MILQLGIVLLANQSISLPLNVPEIPAFGREQFKHTIKTLAENIAYDDLYELNTQSGTQWDGFRHVWLRLPLESLTLKKPVRLHANPNFLQRSMSSLSLFLTIFSSSNSF